MFEKFLQSPECMKVLSWLLNHSDGEYSASIIGVECGMIDMTSFMAVLSVLEGVDVITIGDLSDELMISLNQDSSMSQLLIHLKNEFNDLAFNSQQVSPSLACLHSDNVKKIVDTEVLKNIGIETTLPEDILDVCKNYKELDTSDSVNRDIFNLCSQLEENGEYEEFIRRLEEMVEK